MDRPQIIGYARASVTDKDLAAQEAELVKAGCQKIFVERPDRVTLLRDSAIEAVPVFGELVITRLDRLALHAGDLLRTIQQLHHKIAKLRVLHPRPFEVRPEPVTSPGSFMDHLKMLTAVENNHFREGRPSAAYGKTQTTAPR
jgi:DNA invertase Pin-like site-specific DNA recombinase